MADRPRLRLAGLGLVGLGVLLVIIAWPRMPAPPAAKVVQVPSLTAEPIVPTRTEPAPPVTGVASAIPTTGRDSTPTPAATATHTPPATSATTILTPPTAAGATPRAATPPANNTPVFTATGPPANLTPTATGSATAAARATSAQRMTVPAPTVTTRPSAPAEGVLWQGKPRWAAGGAANPISEFDVGPLRLGWYLDWRAHLELVGPQGLEYAQMPRLWGGRLTPDATTIAQIARAYPGSLWLVGNEPDVKWQDNVEPAVYARLYHEAYRAIKEADARAQVAIGGVTQPTPLRLRYLDMVLASYREQFGAPIPVDVWNVHNFVLREEAGSWGVDIPPGITERQGVLYEITDSTNLDAFRQQIVDFRRWMAERGFRDQPLIVSEYGIAMPADYGFPPERVAAFMTATFDLFLTLTDAELGYPADGNRLVQRWCWYSLADTVYPTGNLFDPETREMTALGERWAEYVATKLP